MPLCALAGPTRSCTHTTSGAPAVRPGAALERLCAGAPALTFLPPADSADFPGVLAAADVLLVNERASAVDMSLPSKLTSYFSAGVPVVAAVPSVGGTAAEVARSGGGLLVRPEDPAALLAALEELGRDPQRRERLGAAGVVVHAREELSAAGSLGRLAEVVVRAVEERAARRRP